VLHARRQGHQGGAPRGAASRGLIRQSACDRTVAIVSIVSTVWCAEEAPVLARRPAAGASPSSGRISARVRRAWSSTEARTTAMPIRLLFLLIDAVVRSWIRQRSPFELRLDLVTPTWTRSPRPDFVPPVTVARAARIHSLVVGARDAGRATWCLSRLRWTVRGGEPSRASPSPAGTAAECESRARQSRCDFVADVVRPGLADRPLRLEQPPARNWASRRWSP
jgi:hypothetical protein